MVPKPTATACPGGPGCAGQGNGCDLMSMLPSMLILGAVALVALALTRYRQISENQGARVIAARSLAVALAAQAAHFAEEAVHGLHRELPAMLGQPAMPFSIFFSFNVAWLAIWLASVPGLKSGRAGAVFAAWFLALGGMVNGLAHPLLAAAEGGYFPGLVTSPFVGAACVFLWIRLHQATMEDTAGTSGDPTGGGVASRSP